MTWRHPRLLGAMLLLSFSLNVVALFVPFVEVSKVLGGTKTYNLLTSVGLLWDSGLHILAAVVVAFSIVFPFAKLAVLAWLTRLDRLEARERRWLARITPLGKWSLIDVFIVCFILALSDDQYFVDAAPRPGLLVFLAAITLSIAAGELIAHRAGAEPPPPPSYLPAWLRASVLSLATVAFLGLLAVPFLQIRDWLLSDTAFTLATFIAALYSQGAISTATVLSLGLVAAPAFALAASWTELFTGWRGRTPPRWVRARRQVRTVSLLNVFLAALGIFLLEGDQLMSISPRRGIILLGVLLAVDVAYFIVQRSRAADPAETEERTGVAARGA